jgi:hypothetical protein
VIKFLIGVAVGVVFHQTINNAVDSFLNPKTKGF